MWSLWQSTAHRKRHTVHSEWDQKLLESRCWRLVKMLLFCVCACMLFFCLFFLNLTDLKNIVFQYGHILIKIFFFFFFFVYSLCLFVVSFLLSQMKTVAFIWAVMYKFYISNPYTHLVCLKNVKFCHRTWGELSGTANSVKCLRNSLSKGCINSSPYCPAGKVFKPRAIRANSTQPSSKEWDTTAIIPL